MRFPYLFFCVLLLNFLIRFPYEIVVFLLHIFLTRFPNEILCFLAVMRCPYEMILMRFLAFLRFLAWFCVYVGWLVGGGKECKFCGGGWRKCEFVGNQQGLYGSCLLRFSSMYYIKAIPMFLDDVT